MQSSQTAFQEQQINGPELGDDELFTAFNDEDMPEGMEGMGDFNDIFSSWNDADAVVGNTSLGLPSGGISGGPSGNVIGGVMGPGSLVSSMGGMGRGSMGPKGDCSSQIGSPPSSQPCSPFTCGGSSSYRVCI